MARSTALPSIARATALQVAGHAVSSLATLATLGLAARALGEEGFGRTTFFLALFAILDPLVDLGTMGAAIRRAASSPSCARAAIGRAARVRLLLAALGVVATACVASACGEDRPGTFAIAATYLFGHALAPFSIPLHVELRFGTVAACRATGALAGLLATAVLSASRALHPAFFLLAWGTGSVVSNAAAALAARRLSPLAPAPFPSRPPEGFLRESMALGAGTLLRQICAHLDSFFLRPWGGPAALARFNAPHRLLLVSCALPGYASAAALPVLARASLPERAILEGRIARTLLAVALAGGAAALLLAEPILDLLYGEVGRGAAPAMRLLVPAGIFAFPANLFVVGLIARDRSATLLRISAAGLAVRAALDALLVPAYADRGAAVATAATEGFVLAACLLARKRERS
ncbi:MAG: lipopolysaccharide biosynthesis protein [Planctomycetes bacterium]|nr:lipopolysaccharide biosynthesis protein [Planctomycetota bacterium]